MNAHFCSCTDLKCPCHPANHNKGCDPCVQLNLKQGEIPSCFFRKAHPDISGLKEFTMESFVKFYLEHLGTPDN